MLEDGYYSDVAFTEIHHHRDINSAYFTTKSRKQKSQTCGKENQAKATAYRPDQFSLRKQVAMH